MVLIAVAEKETTYINRQKSKKVQKEHYGSLTHGTHSTALPTAD